MKMISILEGLFWLDGSTRMNLWTLPTFKGTPNQGVAAELYRGVYSYHQMTVFTRDHHHENEDWIIGAAWATDGVERGVGT